MTTVKRSYTVTDSDKSVVATVYQDAWDADVGDVIVEDAFGVCSIYLNRKEAETLAYILLDVVEE